MKGEFHKKPIISIKCVILSYDGKELQLLLKSDLKEKWCLIESSLLKNEKLHHKPSKIVNHYLRTKELYVKQITTYEPSKKSLEEPHLTISYLVICKPIRVPKKYQNSIEWAYINSLPNLHSREKEILNMSLESLKSEVRQSSVGFLFLPAKFTLPALRKLFDSLLEHKLDKRNFRKKLLSKNYVLKLNEKDKSASKKGAFKYIFNYPLYNRTKEFNI